MKKTLLFALAIFTYVGLMGQTTLKYKTHGLIADEINDMVITKYVEPGISGKNVTWDFRDLEITKDFTGQVENVNMTKGAALFNNSNVALQEFNNLFFFDANKKGIIQHGYMSASGRVSINYDIPFVKMQYPFTYGSSFSNPFSGTYNQQDNPIGVIQGTSTVEGDAIGTLLLPNNRVLENVLRVKEVKAYEQNLNNRPYNIVTTTYRWYVENHRFPVLVLINSTIEYESGRNYTSTQAAYNANVVNPSKDSPMDIYVGEISLDAYPNPYKEFVTFRISLEDDAKINLSVYDVSGRKLTTLKKGNAHAGINEFTFSGKEIGVGSGTYIAKLVVNGKVMTKRVVEL